MRIRTALFRYSNARSRAADVLSILTPAYNEEANLDVLYTRLAQTMERLGGDWEWVVVDDHSTDATFALLNRLAAAEPRVRAVRLSRNLGSHVAIACALHHARGDAAVVLAADLQDPPETLAAMREAWREGAQVVWAVRRNRPGEKHHAEFASIYYWLMRHVAGLHEMPSRGADFFLVDRVVIDAFRRCDEPNVSVLALITWLGFRQAYIEYDKQPRAAGRSRWTLSRKIKLVLDSLTAFSDAPIRLCWLAGATLFVIGLAAGIGALVLLQDIGGVLLLIVGVLIALSGVHLVALGLVGEYVWRALAAARRRPLYVVEARTGTGAAVEIR